MKTPIGWKLVGAVCLVPGILGLTFLDFQASGWRVSRLGFALRGAWEDWRTAFFDDPRPGIRAPRKPPRSAP